jgi:hypothetical protein
MSIKVMSLVWDNFKRGGSDKLAMLALADWCNDEGGSLYPSILAVSKKINVKEAQARKIIHRLIDDGYLSVIANHNGGHPGQSRHYRLNVEMLMTPAREYTPAQEYTPTLEDRNPCTVVALPLHSSIAKPSLSVNEPSIGESENISLINPTNPRKVIPRKRKTDWTPKKQKSQLSEFPEVFEVTEDMVEFAVGLGLSFDAIRDSTSKFKDHHISKGNKFKDWKAAWRNWMRKTVEFKVGAAR